MCCVICVRTTEHVGIVSGRTTGCNNVPFHYHGLLNRLTSCLCGEPEHFWILVVVSSCLWFLREELRNAGVSNTLSFMQLTTLASTFCSVHFRLRRHERHNSHKPDRKFPKDNDSVHAHHALLLEETLTMS